MFFTSEQILLVSLAESETPVNNLLTHNGDLFAETYFLQAILTFQNAAKLYLYLHLKVEGQFSDKTMPFKLGHIL